MSILIPLAISAVVIFVVVAGRPKDDRFDNSFALLIVLAVAILTITWGVYGASLIIGD